MENLTTRETLAMCAMIAGKVPEKVDVSSLTTYITSTVWPKISALSTATSTDLPKDVSELQSDIAKLKHPETQEAGLAYILTDAMVARAGNNPKSLEKLWSRVLADLTSKCLPTHVTQLPQALEDYIKDKFFFTTNDSGERTCFWRNLDKPGTIWEEAADSARPFSSLHGTLKERINGTLAMTMPQKRVLVLTNVGGVVKTEVMNLSTLYRRHYKDMLRYVEHSAAETAYKFFIDGMKSECAALDDAWEGRVSKATQATGLLKLPELYTSLDENIEYYEQFYRADNNIVNLTNDPTVDAYAYFDLTSLSDGATPAFDGFLTGVVPECRDSLMAAMYANFFAESHLNQYAWIHGEGGEGKSCLLQAMREYAGHEMCCSLSSDSAKSEFGLEEIIGKRIILYPDVQGGLSVKSGILHKLTGHDSISINRKNKPHVTCDIDGIVWMASNSAPDVSFSNANEARRVVYIKMQQPSEEVQKKIYFLNPDGSFQLDADGNKMNNGYPLKQLLIEEMPHILYKCKQVFERVVPPPYSVIRKSTEECQLASTYCVDNEDDSMTYYMQETFDFTGRETDCLSNAEIIEEINTTLKSHNQPQLNPFTRNALLRKLKTYYKCGVKKSNGVRLHTGIKLKEA